MLDEGLLAGVRREARRRDCDLSTVFNECLRAGLHRRPRTPRSAAPLPAFDLGRPRVNLADRDSLEAAMDAR
jgi:hypothetical protein